jgi:molybdopterin molybdotransferase
MITFEEALEKMLASVAPLNVVSRKLKDLQGYVAAEPLVALMDMPGFDNSAVDGFGVKVADVAGASESSAVKLALQQTLRAGAGVASTLQAGKTIKILTGAPVPDSVDAVIMREYTRENNGSVEFLRNAQPGENIRRRAGEYRKGSDILPAGTLITPPVLGLIATLGHAKLNVYRKPRVAVVSTGDELVKPGRTLLPGQIYDSNSVALSAACRSLGLDEQLILHAREDKEHTKKILKQAVAFADVTVTAGGVSVGEFDFVKVALEEMGAKTQLWKIAMKPGKPVYFGVFEGKSGRNKFVFGLPGNPVSALVTFNAFVRPVVAKMMGLSHFESGLRESLIKAKLTRNIKKKAGRMEFVRAKLSFTDGLPEVTPTGGQDSHMMGGLSQANALIRFPIDAEILTAGEHVFVQILDWQL